MVWISAFAISLLASLGSARPPAQQPLLASPQRVNTTVRPGVLRYAAFGDSWASGVNWGPPREDEYDYPDSAEVCRCRRMNEAYPVQLSRDGDRAWTGGRPLELDYQACHGAWFPDVIDQVRRMALGPAPDFATLMIGGNQGGFPQIVEDCVYQYNWNKNYGPKYPDIAGECFKTIQLAHNKLDALWFREGLFAVIDEILNEPRIWRNLNFRLFILSYAELFNHDDEACDAWSFGLWRGKTPKLTRELRRAINGVIDHGRALYDELINHFLFNPKVRYLDMNHVLEGHRFCEPTEAGTPQAQIDNSWLYSLVWPDCIPIEESLPEGYAPPSNQTSAAWFCRNCGSLFMLGEIQRAFHPREPAHEGYKDSLKQALRRELNFL